MVSFVEKLSDTQLLDAVEKNDWAVSPQCGGGWVIDGGSSPYMAGDADIHELARTRGTLRDAIREAIHNDADGKILAVK